MTIEDTTATRLKGILAKMRHSQAMGAEGWRVAEVRRLPIPLLSCLATSLHKVERLGKWPPSLEWAMVSLIPKGTEISLADFRPISVMNVIYRLWAAVGLEDVLHWQEAWINKAQQGAHKLHGTQDVVWPLALRVDHAFLMGKPLYGIGLDYQKCFDSLPQSSATTFRGPGPARQGGATTQSNV